MREDYQEQIVREFNASIHREFYEQTFPIHSKEGIVWLHTRLGEREEIPGRGVVSFGIMQRVEAPNDTSERVLERVNDLLYRQISIFDSLLRFLKEDSVVLCIMEILKDILDLFHGGRVYIFEYDEYYRYQDCTYEVVAEGVLPEIDSLQRIPTDSLPWWRQQTLSGKPVILDSLDQLPKHAKAEYAILSRQNIKSLMITPLIAGEHVWGYMGIDLEYMAVLKGLPKRRSKEKIEELLERMTLSDVRKKKIAKLSGGMKRRVGIAQALLNEPEVLILDEPTSGLDPGERVRFRNLLSEFASHDRIVLISTHIVSDVEYIATCNAVMKGGKIQAVGTTEELVTLVNGKVWNGTIPAGQLAEYENRLQIVNLRNEADGRISVRYLAEKPGIEDSVPAVPRLEDLYLWMFPESRFDKEAD